MNKKAMFEIGDIIGVRYKSGLFNRTLLTPEEITKSYEYKMFKESNPKLCRLVENDKI